MRDDQRPGPHRHPDDEDDRFDDALDDLFGPDDDEEVTRPQPSRQQPQPPGGTVPPPVEYVPDPSHQHHTEEPLPGLDEGEKETQPRPSGQRPQPAAGSTPPPREYVPDPDHVHEGDEPVLGPANRLPPPSYSTSSTDSRPTATETTIPVSRESGGRNWRRIACFGCLAAVGIPALCLAALIVIGLIVDPPETDPTQVGVFIDDGTIEEVTEVAPTEAPTRASSESGDSVSFEQLDEPFRSIMDGRQPLDIEVDGESGFGALDKPVPLMIRAPLGDGWDLAINSITPNANQLIANANMFNEPPAEGRQFVVASISATNTGADKRTFDASFRLRLASATSGNTYTTFDELDRCGVVPEAVTDDPIAEGESNTGNVCWQVRIDDLDGLVVYSESFNEGEVAIWFDVPVSGSAS